MTVETLDGRLRLGVGAHLHEPEPLRAVGVPIDDDLCTLDRPERREQRLQVGLVDVVSQIAHIQFLTHDRTPKRKADDPRDAFRVEKKGASVEAHWVDRTREKHRPDREDPAVPLGRQTNRPKDNKKWKGLIEKSFWILTLDHRMRREIASRTGRALHFEKYAFTRSSNCSPVILAPQVVGIFTSRFTSS